MPKNNKKSKSSTLIPVIVVIVALGLLFIFKWSWFAPPPTSIYNRPFEIPEGAGRIQGVMVDPNETDGRDVILQGDTSNIEINVYEAVPKEGSGPVEDAATRESFDWGELAYQTGCYFDGTYQVDVVPGYYFVQAADPDEVSQCTCFLRVVEGQPSHCDFEMEVTEDSP